MRVVLLGYYGFGNLGDEAVLEALTKGLSSLVPDVEITVLSAAPRETVKKLPVDAVFRSSAAAVSRAIWRSDVLISGGGSLLQDATSWLSPWYYLAVMWLALWMGKPLVVLGQGIGPVKSRATRKAIAWTLNRALCVVVRDEESLRELARWGVRRKIHVSPDLALLLARIEEPLSKYQRQSSLENVLAVNLRPWPGIYKILPQVAAVCDGAARRLGAKVIFVPMQMRDAEVGGRLQQLMKSPLSVLPVPKTASELMEILLGAKAVLGMRLHMLVFSLACGRPFVGLAYDPKIAALAGWAESAVTAAHSVSAKGVDSAGTVGHTAGKAVVQVLPWDGISHEAVWNGIQTAWQSGPVDEELVRRLQAKAQEGLTLVVNQLRKRFDMGQSGESVKVSCPENCDSPKDTKVLGVRVDRVDFAGAVDWVAHRIANRKQGVVVTANSELVVQAAEIPEVGEIVAQADLVVPDGVGLLWAGAIHGVPFPQRIPGIELMEALVARAPKEGWRVVFYGGRPGVAQKAADNLSKRYPGFKAHRCYHGYLTPEEEAAMLAQLRDDPPHLLFVALGAPRQEAWMIARKSQLPDLVAIGVGGSFDVFSGRLKRAPRWMGQLGLEWLFRLIQEPKRFPRVLALPRFVFLVLKEKLFG